MTDFIPSEADIAKATRNIKIDRAAMKKHYDAFPIIMYPDIRQGIQIQNIGAEWIYELTLPQARMLAGKAHDRRR